MSFIQVSRASWLAPVAISCPGVPSLLFLIPSDFQTEGQFDFGLKNRVDLPNSGYEACLSLRRMEAFVCRFMKFHGGN